MLLGAGGVAAVALLYVLGLFGIAFYVDRRARDGRDLIDHPVIYSLSLAVYCTSWTFYGSVGRAAAAGVGFLPIYLGPTLMALVWWLVLRKVVRIAKTNRITSLADFLGARYGQSTLVGALVTLIAVVGLTPYLALQLKAIAQTFQVLLGYPHPTAEALAGPKQPFYADTALGAAAILALFGIMFGARDLDSSRRHEGLVATIAFESVVKLVAFLAVGIFVTYGLFGGFVDIFARVAALPQQARLLGGDPAFSYGDWAALTVLSMLAILLLPRQFQMAVIGNRRERHIKTAAWMFPAYLLAINLFVLPIAFGGLLTFPGASSTVADYFVLSLPLAGLQPGLALLAFIGGISAAASMVIVESIAVSTMVLNNLVVPWLVRLGLTRDISGLLIQLKRLAIVLLILGGYAYYHQIDESFTLVNIGLISFAAVAQLGPAFFGALYWRGATRLGALAGLSAGFLVWCYTLLLPSFARSGWLSQGFVTDGPFGWAPLRPERLFGLELGLWPNTVFWSLALNLLAFGVVSLATRPSPLELAQAERFVDVFAGTSPPRPLGQAPAPARLEELLAQFIGREQAEEHFRSFFAARGSPDPATLSETDRRELAELAERSLSGAVGTASAQAIMEALGAAATGHFEAIVDVVGRVSQSLEQSRDDLQRRVRELSLLYEATSRIASTLDPHLMMDGLVELVRREFEFEQVAVRLRDAGGRLRLESQAPPGGTEAPRTPSRTTEVGACYLENRLVAIQEPRAMARSSVHAPIVAEERPIGVLSAYSSSGRVYFSPEFLQLFRTLAVQLGLGIENATLYRELGDLSRELEGKVLERTAELEQVNRRLTQLDRLKSDFVSTVSHELRTPLTSIRSLSESLLSAGEEVPGPVREQFLTIITQESQRLSRMITQLLDLSRIEAGKVEWHMEPLDLGEVVAQATRTHRALFEEKQIQVIPELGEAALPVLADRDKLIQVLTNLLSNAAKFTPREGRVWVRTCRLDGWAMAEVEDTGPGVAAEQREAIFEKFRQVGDTLTGKPDGAGLGLPISREIVEHHRGTLTVESEPGHGSCFRLGLPLAGSDQDGG